MSRISWVGNARARLIWVCQDCGATGSGETKDGIEAGYQHRTVCGTVEESR